MLTNPVNALVEDKKEPVELSYLGTVEDNDDPEKLGRIKVSISLFDNCATDELPWVCPLLGEHGNCSTYGGIHVPELGSQVRVIFPTRDVTAPYYTGAEWNTYSKTTFFDDDYPETYGFKDSKGNFVKINKATGTAQFQHKSTSNLCVSPDGSMQVSLSNGAYFTFNNMNAFELNIGEVSVSGSPDGGLKMNASSEVNIDTSYLKVNADVTEFSGDVSVGTGASGMFWTLGHVVTVKSGIIVGIE